MKKIISAFALFAALAGCGGGGDSESVETPSQPQTVFSIASRNYACVTISMQPTSPTNIQFTPEVMSSYDGTALMHTLPLVQADTDGTFSYGKVMPDNRILIAILYPNGTVIAGTNYKVIMAYTFQGTSSINAYSSILCK